MTIKETGNEEHIWLSCKDCVGWNYEEILDWFIARAGQLAHMPIDYNWNGNPNIYLRGKYGARTPTERLKLIDSGFIMLVKNQKY